MSKENIESRKLGRSLQSKEALYTQRRSQNPLFEQPPNVQKPPTILEKRTKLEELTRKHHELNERLSRIDITEADTILHDTKYMREYLQ